MGYKKEKFRKWFESGNIKEEKITVIKEEKIVKAVTDATLKKKRKKKGIRI